MNLPSDAQTTEDSNGNIRILDGRIPLPTSRADARDEDEVADGVRSVLGDMADALQIAHTDDMELSVTKVQDSGSAVHVRLAETVNGIPVYGSDIVTEVRDNDLRRIAVARHEDRVSGELIEDVGDDKLTKRRAIALVKDAIGDEQEVMEIAEMVYYPATDGLHLSWQVDIVTQDADWRYVVNIATEEIYLTLNRRVHATGRGMVYGPNPVVTANDNTFREGTTPEATLEAELQQVDLLEISESGGNFRLQGPWVQIVDNSSPNIAPPEQASSDFFFDRNDDEFEAVNIYHHIDRFQRYMRTTLGITNAVAFSIPADHHAGNGGAFYSPASVSMGFGNSGPTRPDRAEDGDVMIHEYAHAIQDDLVPGWGASNTTTGRNEARAMGEGFGDALTCIYHQEHGGMYQPEVFEDWIFADVGGLRRVDGIKQYPGEGTTGTTGNWQGQFHSDGEIWSATLWNAYLANGGNSSNSNVRATTRKEFLRTLVLHHNKLNTDATMPEAAQAMLEQNVEDPDTQGRQVRALLDSFHDRNILRSSSGVDLWIMDKPGDTGTELTTSPFWRSPDLWIRNSDDGGTSHQAPEFGQDNWFYARVRNRGTQTARAFAVSFEVKIYQGTQFVYPQDFLPATATAVGFNLPPGGSTIVKARWPRSEVPAAGAHGCLLANAYCATDDALAGKHVWEDNNLAQKNLTIVDLQPNTSTDITFQIGNVLSANAKLFRLELRRPEGLEALGVTIVHPNAAVVEALATSAQTFELAERPSLSGAIEVPVAGEGFGGVLTALERERPPVLTVLENSRFHLGLVETVNRGVGLDEGLEISLAPGSVIKGSADAGTVPGHTGGAEEEDMDDAEFFRDDTTLTTSASANAQVDAGEGRLRISTGIAFNPGQLVGLPVAIPPRNQTKLKLQVSAPESSRRGDVHTVDLLQRDKKGRVVGGISVQINVT